MTIALILGGASCVWDDAKAALALADPDAVIAINDMIPAWPGKIDYAVTLHPNKLPMWLAKRRERGMETDFPCWAHRRDRANGVTHYCSDWQGSSGLFAIKVAIQQIGISGAILAGVPMTPTPHFVRGESKPWKSANAFIAGWKRHMDEIKSVARSMSGWTRQQLGAPTPEWLAKNKAKPPSPDHLSLATASSRRPVSA